MLSSTDLHHQKQKATNSSSPALPFSACFPTFWIADNKKKSMDFFRTSSTKPKQKQSPNKHTLSGKRLTQDQVRLLEKSFLVNKKLDPERKLHLAGELGVPPRQVAIWYQNRRARWKTQTLELDHGALQLKLDSAIADKENLQKDVDLLRGELRRAQDLIFSFNNLGKGHPHSSSLPFSLVSNYNCATSGDDGGSGSCGISEDAVNCCWEDDDDAAMRADDLYACLMLNNGSNMD